MPYSCTLQTRPRKDGRACTVKVDLPDSKLAILVGRCASLSYAHNADRGLLAAQYQGNKTLQWSESGQLLGPWDHAIWIRFEAVLRDNRQYDVQPCVSFTIRLEGEDAWFEAEPIPFAMMLAALQLADMEPD